MNSDTLVLIVDDNLNNVQVLGNLLAKEGFKLAVANSGKDALQYLSRKRPSLILLDITMPVMNGFEVCEVIKANPIVADIPIIFISALDSTEEKVKAFEIGGADYVTKPFEPLELLARVRTHVQLSHLNNEVFMQNRELRTQLAFQSCVSDGLETFLDKTLNHEQIMNKISNIILDSFELDVVSILNFDDESGDLESLTVATSNEHSTGVSNIRIARNDCGIVDRLNQGDTFVAKTSKEICCVLSEQIGVMEVVVFIPIFLVENQLWGALLVTRETAVFDLETTVKDLEIIGSNLIRMYFVRKHHEEQLFQSRKMQAVGRLAGGIAHDLNNMLQGIIGYGEILTFSSAGNEEVTIFVKEILNNAEKSASLIKQLLRFAQKDVNIIKDVNINKLILDNKNYFKERLGPNIELILNLSDFDVVIGADADQVKHVLTNLADNAWAAILSEGKVTISTKVIDVSDNHYSLFKDLDKGKYVEITFSDTGCGIEPEVQEHVFEPFYTTKDVGEGVGMGLATVFSIVRQHKGDIKLHSEKNIGTTFKIYFPVLYIVEKQSNAAVNIDHPVKTILVVEDNKSINKLAQFILKDAGYNTLSALTGQEAIDVFKANKDIIDLMLLDIITPDFSGVELYDKVSKIKLVPVIFCSGYDKEHLEYTYDLKIDGQILKKPYTEESLLSKIKSAL